MTSCLRNVRPRAELQPLKVAGLQGFPVRGLELGIGADARGLVATIVVCRALSTRGARTITAPKRAYGDTRPSAAGQLVRSAPRGVCERGWRRHREPPCILVQAQDVVRQRGVGDRLANPTS